MAFCSDGGWYMVDQTGHNIFTGPNWVENILNRGYECWYIGCTNPNEGQFLKKRFPNKTSNGMFVWADTQRKLHISDLSDGLRAFRDPYYAIPVSRQACRDG